MRRVKVTFRPDAIADLQHIYQVVATASGSHAVASKFVARIMARCRRIGDVPRGGRPRDDLMPGLRIVPFEHAAVIAYHADAWVEIVNVFYGGRDYERLFRSDPAGGE